MILKLLKHGQINIAKNEEPRENIIKQLNSFLVDLDLRAVFNYDQSKILLKSTYENENINDRTYILLNRYFDDYESLTNDNISELIELGVFRLRDGEGISDVEISKNNFNNFYRINESFMVQNEDELINNLDCFNKCSYCNYIVQGSYHKSCLRKYEEHVNTQTQDKE